VGKKKKVEIQFCILYSKFNTVLEEPCQEIISEFEIGSIRKSFSNIALFVSIVAAEKKRYYYEGKL
jgi:hypothetical protein